VILGVSQYMPREFHLLDHPTTMKWTLVNMMHMWKDMTMMMPFMSITKKLKDTSISLYLTGRDY
jgi:hypothetical protein